LRVATYTIPAPLGVADELGDDAHGQSVALVAAGDVVQPEDQVVADEVSHPGAPGPHLAHAQRAGDLLLHLGGGGCRQGVDWQRLAARAGREQPGDVEEVGSEVGPPLSGRRR